VTLLPTANPNIFLTIDLFEIVEPEDYTDNFVLGDFFRKEEAVVQRVVCTIEYDLLIASQAAGGVAWTCAIIKMSEQAADNTFTADAGDFNILNVAGRAENLTRLDVLYRSPPLGYTGGFEDLAGGGGAQKGIPFSVGQSERQLWVDLDLRVKRKLKTDDALLALVVGEVSIPELETVAPSVIVDSRVLIYDKG